MDYFPMIHNTRVALHRCWISAPFGRPNLDRVTLCQQRDSSDSTPWKMCPELSRRSAEICCNPLILLRRVASRLPNTRRTIVSGQSPTVHLFSVSDALSVSFWSPTLQQIDEFRKEVWKQELSLKHEYALSFQNCWAVIWKREVFESDSDAVTSAVGVHQFGFSRSLSVDVDAWQGNDGQLRWLERLKTDLSQDFIGGFQVLHRPAPEFAESLVFREVLHKHVCRTQCQVVLWGSFLEFGIQPQLPRYLCLFCWLRLWRTWLHSWLLNSYLCAHWVLPVKKLVEERCEIVIVSWKHYRWLVWLRERILSIVSTELGSGCKMISSTSSSPPSVGRLASNSDLGSPGSINYDCRTRELIIVTWFNIWWFI